jgi:hypothetical protein
LNTDEQFAQLNAKLDGLNTKVDALDAKVDAGQALLVEQMRDIQTEILRGFGAWTEAQTLRLAIVETRLLEIEKRLLMEPPKLH